MEECERQRPIKKTKQKHGVHYKNKDYISPFSSSDAFHQTEKADRAFSLSLRQCRSLSINMLRCIDCFFSFKCLYTKTDHRMKPCNRL